MKQHLFLHKKERKFSEVLTEWLHASRKQGSIDESFTRHGHFLSETRNERKTKRRKSPGVSFTNDNKLDGLVGSRGRRSFEGKFRVDASKTVEVYSVVRQRTDSHVVDAAWGVALIRVWRVGTRCSVGVSSGWGPIVDSARTRVRCDPRYLHVIGAMERNVHLPRIQCYLARASVWIRPAFETETNRWRPKGFDRDSNWSFYTCFSYRNVEINVHFTARTNTIADARAGPHWTIRQGQFHDLVQEGKGYVTCDGALVVSFWEVGSRLWRGRSGLAAAGRM